MDPPSPSSLFQSILCLTPSSWQKLQSIRSKTSGWRAGVRICALSTLAVLLMNCSMVIWAVCKYKIYGGQQILYEGNCDSASRLNTVLHLLVNALSTIILSSSNYCMQCLSAPTRQELDKAHHNGKWLHIGIQSTRNLRSISKRRLALWLLLGLSSLPIHLL